MKIINQHLLGLFQQYHSNYKKWSGINALNWASYVDNSASNEILNKKLTRVDLLDNEFTNQLTDKQFSIAILSWGGMNREHGLSLFSKTEWLELIGEIRRNEITSRTDAYDRFYKLREKGLLPGMGPAYFTKLLCFLNPKLNGYIMDQWTAKSVNLLMNKNIVKLTRAGFVEPLKNDKNNYNVFCNVIDSLSDSLNIPGIDVEESLFSNGGKNKGEWRRVVIEYWLKSNNKPSRSVLNLKNELDMSSYDEVLDCIGNGNYTIDTLANRSKFHLLSEDGKIVIILSTGVKQIIDRNIWGSVLDRIQNLPFDERLLTSRYTEGKFRYNWKDCPNRIICPYIPAILRYFHN